MSEGFNRVILFGNLGADPELRVTRSGTSVLKLRMATSDKYKDRAGTWQERTEWHSVVVWGKRAEGLHRVLGKGSSLLVEGSLRTSSYEDRDGIKRYKTEIHAQNVVLGGRRARPAEPDGPVYEEPPFYVNDGPSQPPPAAPREAPPAAPADDFPDDEKIPF